MPKIQEYGFRNIEHNYFFLEDSSLPHALKKFFPKPETDDTQNTEEPVFPNGLLAYGYIDHTEGICFEVLATAFFDNAVHRLKLGAGNPVAKVQLKAEDLAEKVIQLLPKELPVWDNFAAKVQVVEGKNYSDKTLLSTRSVTNLDSSRNPFHPDEISVYLIKGENQIECCKVLVERIDKMQFCGTLLAEPKADFGIHRGEEISFYNVKNAQGIMCISVFPE